MYEQQNHQDDIMIALLPMTTDWSTLELPHVTLVYAGKVEDRKPNEFNAMAKSVSSLAALSKPLLLSVMNIDKMGPPEDAVSALMLRPTTELMAMRNIVSEWDTGKYPVYMPHATIGPYPTSTNAIINQQIAFDRLAICWGQDHLVFNMIRR